MSINSIVEKTTMKRAIQRRSRHMRRAVKRNVLKPVRMLTSPIRVLPDFIVIGAQKCGTTSLFDYLRRHPQIARAFEKEVRYFDLNFAKGQGWYRSHFPTAQRVYFDKYLLRRELITGEATPDYLWDPRVPQRVHDAIPHAKLIVLLRNPVDRTYSHYHHEVRLGREKLSFEAAIQRECDEMIPHREQLIKEEGYLNSTYRWHWYLSRGIYIDQLEKWADLFPEENIHVEMAEDFFADTTASLNRVLGFLGLPPSKPISYKKRNSGTYSKMDSGLRASLVEFFRPHNQRLEDFLGRSLNWDR